MIRILGGGALAAVLVVAASLNGCVGSDPESSSGGETTPEAGAPADGSNPDLAPDAAPPALCPLNCLPPAPLGWQGPSAVFDGPADQKPTACPDLYTQKEVEAHRGMTAKAPECGCGTPSFQGASCTASVSVYGEMTCNPANFAIDVGNVTTAGGCLQVNTGNGQGLRVSKGTLTTRGTCSFPNPVKNIEPPKFEGVQVSCGLPQVAACEGRDDCVASPLPAAPFTRLCIHKEGHEPCPSADYAVRILASKAVDDTRGCSDCAAPTTAGGACGTGWGLNGSNCTSQIFETGNAAGTACIGYTSGQYVDVRGMSPVGITCETTGGKPTGAATSKDDVTFCCNR